MRDRKEYRKTVKYKEMKKKADKKYYIKNKEKILKYVSEWQKKPETIERRHKRQNTKEYKEKRKIQRRKYRKSTSEYNKKWRKEHPEYDKKWYYEHQETRIEKSRKYQKAHQDKVNHTRLIRYHQRWGEDPEYKTRLLLRNALGSALKKYTQLGKIMSSKQYGIDYKAIIEHLKPFPEDLSKYHVDHIKPLCSFNLTNPEEVKRAFAPENHQWLLAEENLKKASQDRLLKNAKNKQ